VGENCLGVPDTLSDRVGAGEERQERGDGEGELHVSFCCWTVASDRGGDASDVYYQPTPPFLYNFRPRGQNSISDMISDMGRRSLMCDTAFSGRNLFLTNGG
jgi:hypothetical protein